MIELLGLAGKAIQSSLKYMSEGMPTATPAQYKQRLLICGQCEHFDNGRCGVCKCFLNIKARMLTEQCPLGLWPDVDISPSTQNVDVVKSGCSSCSQGINKDIQTP